MSHDASENEPTLASVLLDISKSMTGPIIRFFTVFVHAQLALLLAAFWFAPDDTTVADCGQFLRGEGVTLSIFFAMLFVPIEIAFKTKRQNTRA